MKLFSFLVFNLCFLFLNNAFALDITNTVKSTVNNNLKIKIALEQIRESEELIVSAYGNYKPDITLNLTEKQSSTETKTSTTTTTTNKLADTYSLSVTQNLYDGGNKNLNLEKSKILFKKQIEDFNITINDLILSAINGYLSVQLYEKSLELTKKNYDIVKKIYDDTLNKRNLGVATLSELKNAESSFENAKSNLIIAEGNLKIGKKIFSQIVGLEANNLEDLVNIDDLNSFEEIFNYSLMNNHELIKLKYDLEISKLELDIQKNGKLPSLDLTGDISYNDNVSAKGTESTSGSISATLSIPIYQKGINNSNIRKYQSKLIQSEFIVDDKINDLSLEISTLLNNYNNIISKYKSANTQIEANKISLSIIQKEYQSGIRVFTDLIDQEEKLLDSYLYSFNQNNDLLVMYFEILAIQGKLIDLFSDFLPEL